MLNVNPLRNWIDIDVTLPLFTVDVTPGRGTCVRGWEETLPPDPGLPRPPSPSAQQASATLPARAARESRIHRCES